MLIAVQSLMFEGFQAASIVAKRRLILDRKVFLTHRRRSLKRVDKQALSHPSLCF